MIYIFLIIGLISFSLYKANKNTKEVIVNTVSPFSNESPTHNQVYLRVLQISDMHLENLSISPEKLYNQVKHKNFDLIALTGDFLDKETSIPKLIPYLNMFKKLNPTYGIYAVFGNHDYRLKDVHFQKLHELLEQYSIKTMKNQNETIEIQGHDVHIIGIDDHHTRNSDIERAYMGIGPKGYRLVLTHDPNIVIQMEKFQFDYLMAGHFHGGQICWPKPYHLKKFGKLVHLNLIKGLINYQGKVFYINEGLGQTLFNIRVGSRPEITIHELAIGSLQEKKEWLEEAI